MHPNSLANLRPRWRKGESGNPAGKNGWMASQVRYKNLFRMVDLLDELEDEELRQQALRKIAHHILDGSMGLYEKDGRALFWLVKFAFRS